jgi:YfiH family protein
MHRPEVLTSPLLLDLGFRHAFFTRHGGWSEGPFASLNLSSTVGDDPVVVEQNLRLAAAALGLTTDQVLFCNQVHGTIVATVYGEEDAGEVRRLDADAVIVRHPGRAAAVRTADCVPILVGHVDTGKVCAIHAGWKGVEGGVVRAALLAMREQLGPGRLVAAIGPHISQAAFEVSEEVAQRLETASPVGEVVLRGGGEAGPRPHVNLLRIVTAQLVVAGLRPSDIDLVAGCTVGEPERFFSFRRDGTLSGRHLHLIVAR